MAGIQVSVGCWQLELQIGLQMLAKKWFIILNCEKKLNNLPCDQTKSTIRMKIAEPTIKATKMPRESFKTIAFHKFNLNLELYLLFF